ncbi:hypothetical protein ACWCOW_41305 [Streptomyces sp. NPDC001939]|uniref:hypothetical protein n=1 Tax=Streptomyces TaxID=1883 RepID=UPI001D0BB213|nr:hypothetical protein [Streptomyces longhuiensis]UDL96835.1 hypothetical protein LGI35_00140 [Streptomyces longhuiensis]
MSSASPHPAPVVEPVVTQVLTEAVGAPAAARRDYNGMLGSEGNRLVERWRASHECDEEGSESVVDGVLAELSE